MVTKHLVCSYQLNLDSKDMPQSDLAEFKVNFRTNMDEYIASPFRPSDSSWGISSHNVHGVCCLPPGYALSLLPSDVLIADLDGKYEPKEKAKKKFTSIMKSRLNTRASSHLPGRISKSIFRDFLMRLF